MSKVKLEITEKNNTTADQLRSFVERIERLETEKKDLNEDIKEIFGEAKANGYDPKIMKKLISLRKLEPHEIEEQDAILDIYKQALGMI